MPKISDALLIIDLQNGVCTNGKDSLHDLSSLTNLVNNLIEKYQKNRLPIIFIQHSDDDLVMNSKSWEIYSEIAAVPDAFYIKKTHANSFYKTNLQELLTDLSAHSIEICGAQTQFCIDATIKVAHNLSYEISMKKNASTTYNNDFMSAENTIRFYENIWNNRFLTLYD